MAEQQRTLAERLDGILFFPVTAFDETGKLDVDVYRQHVRTGIDGGAAAVFACCGTGEFPALDVDEYFLAVKVAVEEAAGQVPVIGGVGHGTALAKRFAQAAESAGADGLLVMPPYLVRPGQGGLRRHFEEIAASTALGIILYQRDNAIMTPETVVHLAKVPTIIGMKDGYGDFELLQRTISAVRKSEQENETTTPLLFLNGMATAEVTQQAYGAIGVKVYSSAVYCYSPAIAMAFWKATERGDTATLSTLMNEFFAPLAKLRDTGEGYAVSLVKAGVRLKGLNVGLVRSPLIEPTAEDIDSLAEIIRHGEEVVAGL